MADALTMQQMARVIVGNAQGEPSQLGVQRQAREKLTDVFHLVAEGQRPFCVETIVFQQLTVFFQYRPTAGRVHHYGLKIAVFKYPNVMLRQTTRRCEIAVVGVKRATAANIAGHDHSAAVVRQDTDRRSIGSGED